MVDTPAPLWKKPFNHIKEQELIGSAADVMNIKNSDEANCPVEQCELRSSDCSEPYTSRDNLEGTTSDTHRIHMDSVSPFNVYAKVNYH